LDLALGNSGRIVGRIVGDEEAKGGNELLEARKRARGKRGVVRGVVKRRGEVFDWEEEKGQKRGN